MVAAGLRDQAAEANATRTRIQTGHARKTRLLTSRDERIRAKTKTSEPIVINCMTGEPTQFPVVGSIASWIVKAGKSKMRKTANNRRKGRLSVDDADGAVRRNRLPSINPDAVLSGGIAMLNFNSFEKLPPRLDALSLPAVHPMRIDQRFVVPVI